MVDGCDDERLDTMARSLAGMRKKNPILQTCCSHRHVGCLIVVRSQSFSFKKSKPTSNQKVNTTHGIRRQTS
jgi:hypothetical protein